MIQIENLGFSYGSSLVLKNISMTLQPGKIYGLLGENGVGKTTLLTLLCGLKKVKSGSISVDGFDPYRRSPELLAEQSYLADEMTARPVKAEDFAASAGPFWPGYDHSRFLEIMEMFGNDPGKKMNAMSEGQLKKTYIAFALSLGCKYLYLDEPTNGLDIPSKAQFRSALTRYGSDDGTVVISTHQVRDLENIIDPIIILDKQDVILNAGMEEIAERLYFDYGNVIHPDSLYSEQLPGGFIQVYPNPDGSESKVNIEALFNAAYKHKDFIKGLFGTASAKSK